MSETRANGKKILQENTGKIKSIQQISYAASCKEQICAVKGIQLSKTLLPAAKQFGNGF